MRKSAFWDDCMQISLFLEQNIILIVLILKARTLWNMYWQSYAAESIDQCRWIFPLMHILKQVSFQAIWAYEVSSR